MKKSEIVFVETDSHMIYGHYYNEQEQALYLQFNNMRVWKYTPFTLEEYYNFKDSKSLGKHFYKHIKNTKEAKSIKE